MNKDNADKKRNMNVKKVKTLFIGSGIFAVEILKGILSAAGVELLGVITQPDKPAGRKHVLTPSPVANYIQGNTDLVALPVLYPVKLKDEAENIVGQFKPELVIVADYGQIIPDSIINYPKYKCLNVHGSLLPDLRGAVPIPMAILKGYEETGISIPIMTSKMDDGDIVAFQKEQIRADDTTESLKARLAVIGANLVVQVLPDWVNGNIKPIAQDESKATFTWQKDIAKEKAQILPDTSPELANRMVRAFYPWPVAWCNIDDGRSTFRLKIIQAQIDRNAVNTAGLRFIKVQKEGRKETSDCGFLKNARIVP